MSLTLTLVLLFLIEIVAIAAITAAIVRLRKDKNSELIEIYRKRISDYEEKLENELVDLNNIGEKLGLLLEPIKEITFKHRKNEAVLYDKRIEFIQSEIQALINKEYGEKYWDKLCIRLSELMPSPAIESDSDTTAISNNEEMPGVLSSAEHDIPVLSQKIRVDKNTATIAYVTLTPLQNEINRLKRIVGRHFGLLSDMKQAITENNQSTTESTGLVKSLKDLQILHVQLTRGVKALKDEHARISKLLTTKNTIAGGSTNMLDDSKQKALDAIRQSQPKQSPVPARKRSGN